MANIGGSTTRLSWRWNDERARVLRSSAADIRQRAAKLGQWRDAFDCAYFSWSAVARLSAGGAH